MSAFPNLSPPANRISQPPTKTMRPISCLSADTFIRTERWTDSKGKEHYGYFYEGDPNTASRLWSDGKIGMTIPNLETTTMGGGMDPEILGIAPLPTGPGGKRGAALTSRLEGIWCR